MEHETIKPKIDYINNFIHPPSPSYSSPPWLGAVKIFSPTNLRLPHHIPLITAPSLWWSLAMELIYFRCDIRSTAQIGMCFSTLHIWWNI
jgi:hypothetical protein